MDCSSTRTGGFFLEVGSRRYCLQVFQGRMLKEIHEPKWYKTVVEMIAQDLIVICSGGENLCLVFVVPVVWFGGIMLWMSQFHSISSKEMTYISMSSGFEGNMVLPRLRYFYNNADKTLLC